MSEQSPQVESTAGGVSFPQESPAATSVELAGQLAEREEEVLRLRDLLIGKDAELGVLRGRLAALEQHSQRLTNLVATIPIPGLGRLVAAVLRRLQG